MAEPEIYWAGTPNYTPGNYGIEALFPHWTCGGFDASVATLQNPAREASAHYVIEGGRVAQLVDESDSAWHCGNYYYNMRAIAYELVGWPGNPPSYDTLDTCARMMADASRRYFGGARLVLGENVMLHQWVYATSCPGETDVNWLVERANYYLNGESEDDMGIYDAHESAAGDGTYGNMSDRLDWVDKRMRELVEPHDSAAGDGTYGGIRERVDYIDMRVRDLTVSNAALSEAVRALAESKGADPEKVAAAVDEAVRKRLEKIKLNVSAA